MNTIIPSQMRDALIWAEALGAALDSLPDEPQWGGGMHLVLPSTIPLTPDGDEGHPVAWLVVNEFNGYDLTTTQPEASDA